MLASRKEDLIILVLGSMLLLVIWSFLFVLTPHHLQFVIIGEHDRIVAENSVTILEVGKHSKQLDLMMDKSYDAQHMIDRAFLIIYTLAIGMLFAITNSTGRTANIILAVVLGINCCLQWVYYSLFIQQAESLQADVRIFIEHPSMVLLSFLSLATIKIIYFKIKGSRLVVDGWLFFFISIIGFVESYLINMMF